MITHTFKPGAIISPRTFISLVVSASEPQPDKDQPAGFYTVQIPLSFSKEDYSSAADLQSKIKSAVPKNTIFAHYASVEHVVVSKKAAAAGEQRQIEWTMATTSDAGGLIPQWVQRSWTMGGVPKAVVADVGLFLGWTDRQRRA